MRLLLAKTSTDSLKSVEQPFVDPMQVAKTVTNRFWTLDPCASPLVLRDSNNISIASELPFTMRTQ